MRLYYPQSEEENVSIAGIAGAQLGMTFSPPFMAMASVNDRNDIVGVVIFNNFDGANIDITAVGKGAWSPGVVKAICQYVFDQLGCARITAKTHRSNKRVCRLLAKHAKYETPLKHWYGVGKHGVQYRMSRDECPFLRKENGIEPVLPRAA
jgi:hypothetical protein